MSTRVGSRPSTARTWAGPGGSATCGARLDASQAWRTPAASSSEDQRATPNSSRSAPVASSQWRVTSSGAISAVRAPSSPPMFVSVMRSAIVSAPTASPQNSMTWPLAPSAPRRSSIASTMSFALTPSARRPLQRANSVAGVARRRSPRASALSSERGSRHSASAPKAPAVEVRASEPMHSMPGRSRPVRGTITWPMPRPSNTCCRRCACAQSRAARAWPRDRSSCSGA
jgi:hypothetical protein